MNKQQSMPWCSIVTIVSILFGLLCVSLGLKIFSGPTNLISQNMLLSWESALYGAIMVGWGVTLLLVGRLAFRQQSQELQHILLIGITTWLVLEAITSTWLGVWFTVGVDAVVLALFAMPLVHFR